MGEVPSSKTMLCSTPLSGGLPCGRPLKTFSYFCNSFYISFGCSKTFMFGLGDLILHSAAHSMSPCLNIDFILLQVTT